MLIKIIPSKAGEILVSWHPPLSLDSILFPKPYKYILRRYDNFSSNDNEFTFSIQEDTFFVDMDLNSKEKVFNYQVEVLDSAENSIDFSAQTSSVKLDAEGQQESIVLSWKFNVPWSNNSNQYPQHYIYRNHVDQINPDSLILIDSVNAFSSLL